MEATDVADSAVPASVRTGLDQFCNRMKEALGEQLVSVVLYGSVARKEYHPGASDVNVMVANESADNGDTTPPKVTITSPGDGATVSGTVSLSAFATDDTKVAMVKIYVDGKLKCAGSPSTSCGWNTRKAGSGSHTVSATAEDGAGNTATKSVAVSVTARTRGNKGKGQRKKP